MVWDSTIRNEILQFINKSLTSIISLLKSEPPPSSSSSTSIASSSSSSGSGSSSSSGSSKVDKLMSNMLSAKYLQNYRDLISLDNHLRVMNVFLLQYVDSDSYLHDLDTEQFTKVKHEMNVCIIYIMYKKNIKRDICF